MTIRPIGSIGWRTVVSGGSVQFIRDESSKPTTDTSPGTRQAGAPGGPDRAERHRVAGADDAGDARPEQPRRRRLGGLERVQRVRDLVGPERDARPRAATPRGRASLRRDGTWSGGPSEQPDPRVAEREQVAHRLLDGDRVVARHPRERRARRCAAFTSTVGRPRSASRR